MFSKSSNRSRNSLRSTKGSREEAHRRLQEHREEITSTVQVLDNAVNRTPVPLQYRAQGAAGRGGHNDDLPSSIFQSSLMNSFSDSRMLSRPGGSSSLHPFSNESSANSSSVANMESSAASSFPDSEEQAKTTLAVETVSDTPQRLLDQAIAPLPAPLNEAEYRAWLHSKTTVTLKETPTIMLYSNPDTTVSNENPQDVAATTARNEELEKIQETHRLDEGTKYQNRGAITFIPPKKSIHSEVHPPVKVDSPALQVTPWMLKDEFAPLLDGDEYDEPNEDDDQEVGEELDDELNAVSGDEAPSAVDSTLLSKNQDEKSKGKWLLSDSLQSNLRIMERAVVQNYFEHLQLQYRGISADPSVFRYQLPGKVEKSAVPEEADGKPSTALEDAMVRPGSPGDMQVSPAAATPVEVPQLDKDAPELDMSPEISFLWRFHSPLTKNRSVTCMTWNRKVTDLLVVGYSVKQVNALIEVEEESTDRHGLVCCWSLKNPLAPELALYLDTDASVSAVAFSYEHPSLLAVGNTAGGIVVYDIQRDLASPSISPAISAGQHTGAVWDLKWVGRGKERGEFLMSVSADGRVVQWIVGKSIEKIAPDLMHLQRQSGQHREAAFLDGVQQADEAAGKRRRHNKEAMLTRQCGGMCFDICPTDTAIYIVGTEDGSVFQCNKSQTENYDLDYLPHAELVYRIRWSPYSTRYFLTCSADWTMRLYRLDQTKPMIRFDSPNQDSIQDIAWSYTNALHFASVTAQGNVEIWTIMDSIYPRWTIQYRDHRRLHGVLFAEQEHPVIIVGDEEGDVCVFALSGHGFTRQGMFDDEQENWLEEAVRKQQS